MNPPVELWWWDGQFVRDAHGVTQAVASDLNLLFDDIDAIVGAAHEAPAVVVCSGWTQQTELEDDLPWSARVRALLDERLAHLLTPAGARNVKVWLRPRHSDVISDIPSTLQVLRAQSQPGLGLWLDPAALLAESMRPRAEEHLARITEALAMHPRCAAVDLSGADAIGVSALAECARAAASSGKVLVAPRRQDAAVLHSGIFGDQ